VPANVSILNLATPKKNYDKEMHPVLINVNMFTVALENVFE
jgi:hypothetical protein